MCTQVASQVQMQREETALQQQLTVYAFYDVSHTLSNHVACSLISTDNPGCNEQCQKVCSTLEESG